MRLRTIAKAVEELKAEDPNSAITNYFIRCLCQNGEISFTKSGKKYFVNLDSLNDYLKEKFNERKSKI